MVLAPATYTLLIVQFYMHTTSIESFKSSLPVFKSAGVIEPVAQMLISLWANRSLSAIQQLSQHCYTKLATSLLVSVL